MRSLLIVLGLITLTGSSLYAQEIWYLNHEFGRLKSKKKASYYAEVFKNDSAYHIKVFLYPGLQRYSEGYYTEPDFNTKYRLGKLSFYYPNGQLKSFLTYGHGKKEGPFAFYTSDGTVREEGTYAAGLLEGEFKNYYSNGQLKLRQFYQQDTLEGAWTRYFSNGNLMSQGERVKGRTQGLIRYYFRDTAVMHYEAYYKQGKRNGQATYFYHNGSKAAVELYKDDSLLEATSWNEQGKITEHQIKSQQKECMPTFPGGEEAMMRFMGKEIKYPEEAKENGITGKVWLEFVVMEDGSIEDLDASNDLGYGLEEAALQAAEKFPRWEPCMNYNRFVPILFKLPVRFELK